MKFLAIRLARKRLRPMLGHRLTAGLTCRGGAFRREVLPMDMLASAFRMVLGIVKLLRALVELETAKSRRREVRADARRHRRLK